MMKMQKRSLQNLSISDSKLGGLVDVHILQLRANSKDEYMTKEKEYCNGMHNYRSTF